MCMYCGRSKCPGGCPGAPEPQAVGTCVWCGEDIVVGDKVYFIDGSPYHDVCVRDNGADIIFDILADKLNVHTAEADRDGFCYLD